MRSEIWAVNICMNRCGLMLIFSSVQRLNLIYRLTGFSFIRFNFQKTEKNRRFQRDQKRNNRKNQSNCAIVSPTPGEVARESQTVNVEGTKTKNGLDVTGGRGNSQMLLIPVVGRWKWKRGNLSHRESEMSTDWFGAELGPSGRSEYQHRLRGRQDFGTIAQNHRTLLRVCIWKCVHVAWGRMWDWLSLLS